MKTILKQWKTLKKHLLLLQLFFFSGAIKLKKAQVKRSRRYLKTVPCLRRILARLFFVAQSKKGLRLKVLKMVKGAWMWERLILTPSVPPRLLLKAAFHCLRWCINKKSKKSWFAFNLFGEIVPLFLVKIWQDNGDVISDLVTPIVRLSMCYVLLNCFSKNCKKKINIVKVDCF